MNWEKMRKHFAQRNARFRQTPETPRLNHEASDVQFAPEWEEQLGFDASLSHALRSQPVPPHLREAILATGPQPPPVRSQFAHWRPSLRRVKATLGTARTKMPGRWRMACFAVLAGVIAWLTAPLWSSAPPTFQSYRAEVVANAWTAPKHLALQTNDLSKIQQWIKKQNAPWPAQIPKTLEDFTVAGGRVIYAHRRAVTLLCFANGVHHCHLFVVDEMDLPGTPGEQFPYFSRCQGWETASWTSNGQTYILTGIKGSAFVKQFRREGHWEWNS